jgi:MarR family 2-MHQ and catechol resistance regulon transcriptional repressor
MVDAPRTALDSSSLDRDAAALHAAVAELVRIYQFRDRDQICCYDVSVTQCYALEILSEQGPMRLHDLAERMYLDKSTTSRVVGALVRKGYVEQRRDPSDGRAITIRVTRRGSGLCARITDELVAQQRSLLQDLDVKVRAGVVQVLRGLASAADARFRIKGAGCVNGCCPS